MERNTKITKDLAFTVLCVVDKGLVHGMGRPIPGEMCVEAAVNYAQGNSHDDEPNCVESNLRNLKINLNDYFDGLSGMNRAKALRRVAIAQLGSFGILNWKRFTREVNADLVKNYQPASIENKEKVFKQAIKQLGKKSLSDIELDKLLSDLQIVKDKWSDKFKLSHTFPVSAFYLIETVAASLGVDFNDDPDEADKVKVLTEAAEVVVRALKKQRIPGTKYLYLTEKKYTAKQQNKILDMLYKKHNS